MSGADLTNPFSVTSDGLWLGMSPLYGSYAREKRGETCPALGPGDGDAEEHPHAAPARPPWSSLTTLLQPCLGSKGQHTAVRKTQQKYS